MLETVTGAMMVCAGGGAELIFDGLPELNVLIQSVPAGKFSDIIPEVNLTSAGICAILTTEAGGIPVPCVPVPVGPWITGFPTVLINGSFALDNFSMCECSVGGLISIVFPNNETVWLM